MLPEAERLRKAGLFQRVYTARKTVSTALLSLYVMPRLPKSSPRLPLTGFVAAKKVMAKANQRNRAKRRAREAYRAVKKELEAQLESDNPAALSKAQLKQWYAIVWVIQADVLKAEYRDIIKAVCFCLEKANQKFGMKRASS